MANADDFCQYARLGQTVKIQKSLQSHSIDINALNLYGESALSTATYYNQVLCVEYLLANKADPKLRLSAGHTAIHIACRLGNVPILHMLLSIKKNDDADIKDEQQREDKHVYECLKMKDASNLTPIHWAATQESVSKRQKMFAYLDKRMPGVLDSRYNLDWFNSWTKSHEWVLERKTNIPLIQISPKFTNPDHTYQQDESSEITSLDMTPKVFINNYERTPRVPLTATTNNQKSSKLRVPHVQTEQSSRATNLPPTPMTSCKVTVTSVYHIPKREQKHLIPPKIIEPRDTPLSSQKVPTELNHINDHSLHPHSERFTYRARRVPIEPTIEFPPPPPITTDMDDTENGTNQEHDYEDVNSPSSSKRPSHNLLSNIVPSIATPSTDQSSQQSTKHIASSFGFDTCIEPNHIVDTTIHSNTDTYAQNDEQVEIESTSSDDDDGKSNQVDYLCKSTSTLAIASPGAHTYYS
ncbi:unnamed protein product [Rotaria socialis]|uniref:Uncharacterized protein n=1 Tax=Rotaria socialis TaxID=392032 RepID=A0A818CAT4_9BILA|nr:unnamed protein product [Rotaria socialis]CAF4705810.1 unnamed protein product [Rotaria socialis]